MRNWDTRDESGTDVGCEWEKDWEDVQRVCQKLDIPCRLVRQSHRLGPVTFDAHEQKSLDRPVKRLLAKGVRARDQDMGEGKYAQSRCLV
jgi:hypothetical protein